MGVGYCVTDCFCFEPACSLSAVCMSCMPVRNKSRICLILKRGPLCLLIDMDYNTEEGPGWAHMPLLLTVYARMQVIQVITWAPAGTVRQSTVNSGLLKQLPKDSALLVNSCYPLFLLRAWADGAYHGTPDLICRNFQLYRNMGAGRTDDILVIPSVLPFPPSVSTNTWWYTLAPNSLHKCSVSLLLYSHPSLTDFKSEFTIPKVAFYIKQSRNVSGHTFWMMQ